jgi:hypothetical protein
MSPPHPAQTRPLPRSVHSGFTVPTSARTSRVGTADGTSGPPVRPLSELAAHPAGQPSIGPAGDRPAGGLSFGALRAIAAGLARVQQPVPPDDDDLESPRSIRLLATAYYDVWLITWPDGSGMASHDHGGVRSVLHVIDGELVEVFTDHVDGQVPAARVLRRGDSTCAKTSFIHDLANRSGADATTLHVYSPPLTDVSFFDVHPAGGDFERLRTTAAADRVPRASSNDLPPLRPPPLSLVED